MSISVRYLQDYIKAKDHHPEAKQLYFMKLSEEVGELARAMRKDLRPVSVGQVKETVEEELWDVIYYALTIANAYDIDIEAVIPAKEAINNVKYNSPLKFGDDL